MRKKIYYADISAVFEVSAFSAEKALECVTEMIKNEPRKVIAEVGHYYRSRDDYTVRKLDLRRVVDY